VTLPTRKGGWPVSISKKIAPRAETIARAWPTARASASAANVRPGQDHLGAETKNREKGQGMAKAWNSWEPFGNMEPRLKSHRAT
jgi:hypothetical protein